MFEAVAYIDGKWQMANEPFSLTMLIVILDFRYCGKWNLNDVAVWTLDLHTRSSQRLCGLHAANRAAHPTAVGRYDLNVALAI
jgi:hypothetical protein